MKQNPLNMMPNNDVEKLEIVIKNTEKQTFIHWHPIHAKRTWMTPHKASLSVETGNYLKAI